MKRCFVFFIAIFLTLCSLPEAFSDELSKERLKLLETQANEVGISGIDTFKKVFALHDAMYNAVGERSGVYADYYGLSFKTSKLNDFVLYKTEPYGILEEHPGSDYLFTVPVIYDYCVMISRISDRLEVTNDIQNKVCATFKSDIITGEWCSEYGITKFDRDNFVGSSAFQKIIEGEADLIFMPRRLAVAIIDLMHYNGELYISRPLFEINYRFAFKAENRSAWERMNVTIIDMIESGELESLCNRFTLSQSLVPEKNIQRELLLYVLIFLSAALAANLVILVRALLKKNNLTLMEAFSKGEETISEK